MSRYKMVVMSSPVEGREDEYNAWYQNVHLAEIVAFDGFISARRFCKAHSLTEGNVSPYLAVYEMETDDIDGVLEHFKNAAEQGRLTMSDSLDLDNTRAAVYQEFGDVVSTSSV